MRLTRSIPPLTLLLSALLTQAADRGATDFSSLSLEQLSNIKITSFTKQQQQLSHVAGAVYVISREQILRSGLTSVPELLRLAPGIQIARVNSYQWCIGSRGALGIYAARLLVLIDGRSVYTPVFSGVYWDAAMPPIELIERIEVIRGPGATVWGANAVNGVINIITQTSGGNSPGQVTFGAGNQDRASALVVSRGSLGSTSWRVHASGAANASMVRSRPGVSDDWSSEQAGVRMDGVGRNSSWMLSADVSANPTSFLPPATATGVASERLLSLYGSINGEYRHQVKENGELRLRASYDRSVHEQTPDLDVTTGVWDSDLRYEFNLGSHHSTSLGGGVRAIAFDGPATGQVHFQPDEMRYANYNIFAQHALHYWNDRLVLTAGSKLEHNYFTGWGPEPSASVLWLPHPKHTIWVSAARSLRTPSILERGVKWNTGMIYGAPITNGAPFEGELNGSPVFGNEIVSDYQAGYRADATRTLTVDVSYFYDRYSALRSLNPVGFGFRQQPTIHLVLQGLLANGFNGDGTGAEASLTWHPISTWKFEGGYTYLNLRTWQVPGNAGAVVLDSNVPSRNRWVLQSYWNPRRSLQVDTVAYWTGARVGNSLANSVHLHSYARVDARIGYRLGGHWTFSLGGQNLLSPRHVEGFQEFLNGFSEVRRSFYLKCTWQF